MIEYVSIILIFNFYKILDNIRTSLHFDLEDPVFRSWNSHHWRGYNNRKTTSEQDHLMFFLLKKDDKSGNNWSLNHYANY